MEKGGSRKILKSGPTLPLFRDVSVSLNELNSSNTSDRDVKKFGAERLEERLNIGWCAFSEGSCANRWYFGAPFWAVIQPGFRTPTPPPPLTGVGKCFRLHNEAYHSRGIGFYVLTVAPLHSHYAYRMTNTHNMHSLFCSLLSHCYCLKKSLEDSMVRLSKLEDLHHCIRVVFISCRNN
jgi:hypothetical protein